MSQIIDQAESLRLQAIGILMAERQTIDQKLATLGADGTETTTTKKIKACRVCSSESHNARTCPQKGGRADTPTVPAA
jgi:hypothetical protein